MTESIKLQRLKILINESSDAERKMYGQMLSDEYDILEAGSSDEAVNLLDKYPTEVALILLGLDLTKMDSFDLLERMQSVGWIEDIPVIVISSDESSDLMQKAYDLGATDYISKSTQTSMIKKRIRNTIRLFAKQKSVLLLLEERNRLLSERNYRLENIDELTGCLNLEGFRQRVRDVLRMYPERQYAMCYMDVKHFKFVNEFMGYEEGNKLLKYWSRLVKEQLADDEAIGRIGGDCLVVFVRAKDTRTMSKPFRVLREKVGHYFDDKTKTLKVDLYAGVYIIESNVRAQMNVDQMIDLARIAQRMVKNNAGGGVAFFDEEQWNRQWRNMAIVNHFEDALRDGEIYVYLQPQYNYITSELIGAEALCRWNHAELGPVSPAEFIPILESTGQIFKLDYFIWDKCCSLMRKWIDEDDIEQVSLSVNISRADLKLGNVPGILEWLVKNYSLDPKMLRLEITESAYMDDPEQLVEAIRRCKEKGFTVEMDDFGSGFSSLNMLKDVPVDALKIDFKFLYGLDDSKTRSGIILSSILKMAHQMGMPVICEGVETREQGDFMKNIGFRLMQGYYFARPMSVESFENMLRYQNINVMPEIVSAAGRAKLNELMVADSSSSFIFNHCIGGAVLFEYYEEKCDVILANEPFYRVAGIDRNTSLHNINMLDYVAENRAEVIKAMEKAIETGEATCEFTISTNGVWVYALFRHVALAERGSLLFVSIENVTQSHKLRNKLREVNSELQTLLKLVPCGVFRYEAEGNQEFDYVSRGMLDMLGFTDLAEFRKKYNNSFKDMVYADDRERVLKEIDDQIAVGTYDYCNYRIETATGELKQIFDKGHIVYGEDGKKYFYAVIIDMGQAK